MNVLFIGNSHLAAIKTGWDLLDPKPPITPTFIGAKGGGLSSLVNDGPSFRSTRPDVTQQMAFTSGGLTEVDCSLYDAIVTIGLYHGRYRLVETLAQHRTLALDTRVPGAEHLISEAAQRIALRHSVSDTLALALAARFRQQTKAPIYVCEQPMPRCAVTSRHKTPWLQVEQLFGVADAAWRAEMDAQSKLIGFVSVPQPAQTIAPNHLTLDEYGLGAIRLLEGFNEVHRSTEYRHMNAKYGRAVFSDLVKKIRP